MEIEGRRRPAAYQGDGGFAKKNSVSKETVPPEINPPRSRRLANHEYSVAAIFRAVQIYAGGTISFHACTRLITCLQSELPEFQSIPAPNTIQSWFLRIGLHSLNSPKEIADDWAIMLDHTCQLGNQKCLIILGIRISEWALIDRPLERKDMTVLMLDVVERSDGNMVQQQLVEVQKKIGTIASVTSDQGSDLVRGIEMFVESQANQNIPNQVKLRVFKDYSHASSHILKANLLADSQWGLFLSLCGSTQPKVKQTSLGALAPPTQKVKGRYMSIGEMIRWGQEMLALVDETNGELPKEIDRSTFLLKYGWIKDFRRSLTKWYELDVLREQSLKLLRVAGYSSKVVDELKAKQSSYRNHECSRLMADQLVELVRDQCESIPKGTSYPASTEVLESMIGKSKQMQFQHSRGGFTKMVLGIAASAIRITEAVVTQSLEAVREINVRVWGKETIGSTLTSIRRAAMPGIKGA